MLLRSRRWLEFIASQQLRVVSSLEQWYQVARRHPWHAAPQVSVIVPCTNKESTLLYQYSKFTDDSLREFAMHHLGNSEISCGKKNLKKEKKLHKIRGVLDAFVFMYHLAIPKSAATTQNFRGQSVQPFQGLDRQTPPAPKRAKARFRRECFNALGVSALMLLLISSELGDFEIRCNHKKLKKKVWGQSYHTPPQNNRATSPPPKKGDKASFMLDCFKPVLLKILSKTGFYPPHTPQTKRANYILHQKFRLDTELDVQIRYSS